MNDRVYGTDPEFPLYKIVDNNIPQIIPPMALIEDYGVKYSVREDGKKVLFTDQHGEVIEDGAAIEFNIKPSTVAYNLVSNVYKLQRHFENKILIHSGVGVSSSPYGYFDVVEYWEKRNENFRECVIFGCDPDFSPKIYKLMSLEHTPTVIYHEMNNPNFEEFRDDNEMLIVDVSKHTGRYFGGHLHVQNMSNNPDIYIQSKDYVGVVFDFLVGTLNATLPRDALQKELELKRLEFYGRPGSGRIQTYKGKLNGYEYRPLSNYWLQSTEHANRITSAANIAANIVEQGLAEIFVMEFEHRIPDMYTALRTMDETLSQGLLEDTLEWSLGAGFISIADIGNCL